MTLFIDPFDPELEKRLSYLQSTKGYCIFVDIIGSTQLKDKNIKEWVIKIYNAFAKAKSYLPAWLVPIKSIGDELMYFIPKSELSSHGESALGLFSPLCSLCQELNAFIPDVKIGVSFCKEAYEITFIQNVKDVYGKDIDLTARLVSAAKPRQILMNESFVQQVSNAYNNIDNKNQYNEVLSIQGPKSEQFKGFDAPVNVFSIQL